MYLFQLFYLSALRKFYQHSVPLISDEQLRCKFFLFWQYLKLLERSKIQIGLVPFCAIKFQFFDIHRTLNLDLPFHFLYPEPKSLHPTVKFLDRELELLQWQLFAFVHQIIEFLVHQRLCRIAKAK